jgi:hypothetical protein
MQRLLTAVLMTIALVSLAVAGCGIVPVKPVIPIGCKDLKPECSCDSNGQNCTYNWVCVK